MATETASNYCIECKHYLILNRGYCHSEYTLCNITKERQYKTCISVRDGSSNCLKHETKEPFLIERYLKNIWRKINGN